MEVNQNALVLREVYSELVLTQYPEGPELDCDEEVKQRDNKAEHRRISFNTVLQ